MSSGSFPEEITLIANRGNATFLPFFHANRGVALAPKDVIPVDADLDGDPDLAWLVSCYGQWYTLLHPVEEISWFDTEVTLFRLGLTFPAGNQWGYAARAGTTTVWWTGDEPESTSGAANITDRSNRTARAPSSGHFEMRLDDGFPTTAPVDSLRANPFGLHHVIGNVREWLLDIFQDEAGRLRAGGCWLYAARQSRSAGRWANVPEDRKSFGGVRPARVIESSPPRNRGSPLSPRGY